MRSLALLGSQLHLFAAIGWKVLDRFRFGSSFAISPHGVGIAVGYLCGSLIFMHEGPKRGVSEEQVSSLVLWGLIGSIVGARAGYVLAHLSQFHNVVDVLVHRLRSKLDKARAMIHTIRGVGYVLRPV